MKKFVYKEVINIVEKYNSIINKINQKVYDISGLQMLIDSDSSTKQLKRICKLKQRTCNEKIEKLNFELEKLKPEIKINENILKQNINKLEKDYGFLKLKVNEEKQIEDENFEILTQIAINRNCNKTEAEKFALKKDDKYINNINKINENKLATGALTYKDVMVDMLKFIEN